MRLTVLILMLPCVLAGSAHAADDVSRDLMLRFNERAIRAEKALEARGPEAAIEIYEAALSDTEGFGRVHLRLGQLYQQSGNLANAALHYRSCDRDQRVDSMDRELICKRAFAEITAPLNISGLPDRGRVTVLEPRGFDGAVAPGDRLPKGRLLIAIDAPGRIRREVEIDHQSGEPIAADVGMDRPRGPLIPGDFIVDNKTPPPVEPPPEAPGTGNGLPVWPAYAVGGLGAAMVGGGVFMGLSNNTELDDIRSRQRNGGCGLSFCGSDLADAETNGKLADGLWISGAVLATGAVVWWLLADGDGG